MAILPKPSVPDVPQGSKFIMLQDHAPFKKGQVVYALRSSDYGLASDDTRLTGVAHRSLTADPNGSYPGQTVPVTHFRAYGTPSPDTSMAEYQAKITGKRFGGIIREWGVLVHGKDLHIAGSIQGAQDLGVRTSPIQILNMDEKWVETENSVYGLEAPRGT